MRKLALALVIFGLTAQTGGENRLVLCNTTTAWVQFMVITTQKTAKVCSRPGSTSTYAYDAGASLHTLDALALEHADCVGPVIGRATIRPTPPQVKRRSLIAAFEGTLSNWRVRWVDPSQQRSFCR